MTSVSGTAGISIEQPDAARLKALGVSGWPIWTKAPSTFEWSYDQAEQCYFLEGRVEVRTAQGAVRIGRGDFVTFPKGLSCTWRVLEAVRKHYRFD